MPSILPLSAVLRRAVRLLRLAVALAALLMGTGALRAEINAPGTPAVPFPVPVKVEVKRGDSVEITLRIYGRQDEMVKFEVRARPKYGVISEPRMASPSVAVITYRNSGDMTHSLDGFSYVVQTDQGVSAPAAVEITVTDDPPIFAVPDTVEFGEVVVGTTVKKEIVLENQGAGMIDGTMDLDKPWKLEQDGSYHLGAGGKQSFVVDFSPVAVGEAAGEIRYSDHPDRVTSLHATAKAPFSAQPDVVALRNAKGDAVRSGDLQVTNATDAPEKVEIALPGRLQGPKEIELDANESKWVTVKTAPEDTEPIEERLVLSTPAWKQTLTVRGKVLGPVLQAAPEAVSFGDVPVGQDVAASLKVKNRGGYQTVVRVSVPPPFQIADEDATFSLEPGAEKAVSIILASGDAGNFKNAIRIQAAENDLRIPVQGNVTEGEVRKNVVPGFVMEPSGDVSENEGAKGSGIPVISWVFVRTVKSTSCEVDWRVPAPGNLKYVIETRTISLDANRKLKLDWVSLGDIPTKTFGNEVQAHVTGLPPQYPCALRVRWLDSKGVLSPPSRPFYFNTKPKWHLKITPLEVLLAVLAVMLGLVIRQRFFMPKE